MYFPGGKNAKLRDPQTLSLEIAFNGPRYPDNHLLIPFSSKGEYWEAVVPLKDRRAFYAIFAVKNGSTDAVDDNSGQYWDVVFCTPIGEKDSNGLLSQARSYSGESWPFNIRRETDLAKTVSLLETAVATTKTQSAMLLPLLWEYKAKRDGDNDAAYAKLAPEVERYLNEHIGDQVKQFTVGNFVLEHEEKLPADFVERTITKLDANLKDPRDSFRAALAYERADSEPDLHKRLAALAQVIAQYPNSMQVELAYLSRFHTFAELKDLPDAEAEFAKYRDASAKNKDVINPDQYMGYLEMGRLYIERGVKLDAALKLLDQAADSLQPMRNMGNADLVKQAEAQIAEERARDLLGLHKPALAVAQAEKALVALKTRADAHFVLAQAYDGTGEKAKALDEYFEAALMPSNKDLEYRSELQRFYRKNFGNAKQYEVALNQRIAERFRAADYVPKLLDRHAPAFEFTTLKGETFDAAALKGHIVVINFWSPG